MAVHGHLSVHVFSDRRALTVVKRLRDLPRSPSFIVSVLGLINGDMLFKGVCHAGGKYVTLSC